MRTLRSLVVLSALPFLLALSGCDESTTPGSDAGPPQDASSSDAALNDAAPNDAATAGAMVTIDLAHLVGGTPITLGPERPHTNAAGNEFGVTRLTYFISVVTLTFADGTVVSAPGAHYVDHETPSTMSYVLPAEMPTGALTEISFVMGLPPALNVSGAFTSAPESLMEWPEMMGGGYHYMKFEGRYTNSAADPFNFMMHSGGLSGTDYSFEVHLDATGRTVTDGATFAIQMNLEEWFTDPETWDLNDYFNAMRRGIMGNATAQASLQGNGATVFTLGPE